MKPAGTFATSYGVTVPVFENPNDPEGYLFGMEATAICAGIHDPVQRKRFADDATAAGRCEVERLPDYGGGPVPCESIPRPVSPAYLAMPKASELDIPIENWITALLDVHRWCDRADVLLNIIGSNFENRVSNGYEDRFEPMLALGLQIMLTASLEHLAETEIDCLEAAAFYALSIHDEWRRPAIEWLKPMSGRGSRTGSRPGLPIGNSQNWSVRTPVCLHGCGELRNERPQLHHTSRSTAGDAGCRRDLCRSASRRWSQWRNEFYI